MFNISQGTGPANILASFMYKVHTNDVLYKLKIHCYAILLNGLNLSPLSFAGEISLITLQSFMTECFDYSVQWRYELNHAKSGVVTLCQTNLLHLVAMKVDNGWRQ